MALVRGSVAVDENGVVTGSGYALELFNLRMADIELPFNVIPDPIPPPDFPSLPPASYLADEYELTHWIDQFPTLKTTPPPKPTVVPVSEAESQAYIVAWLAAFEVEHYAAFDRMIDMNTRMDLMVKKSFAKHSNTDSFIVDYLKANAVIPAGIPVETTGDEDAQSGATTGPGTLT